MYCRSCTCSSTPKHSAGLITYDSAGYGLIRYPSKKKTHELRNSRKVVAVSQAVPPDFRSQILVRTRIRPDSACFGESIFNPVFVQVSFWTRCVFNQRLFTLLSTFSGTDHFFVMYKTRYTSIAIETCQLRFRRFLG